MDVKEQKKPKITIVTICYNCNKTIEKTIKSVIRQTYDNVEYIIVDGQSTDGTMKIVHQYKDRISKIFSEKDKGISDAFNKGIKSAIGDMILFLNAGDYFMQSNVLDKVAEDWMKYKVDILFYEVKLGNIKMPSELYYRNEGKIWKDAMIPHQSAFVRKEIFSEVGNFNVFLKVRMDYDFFMRCICNNCSHKFIPKIIVNYDPIGVSFKESYLFEKEGLGIKLLYQKKISLREIVMMFRLWFQKYISK